MTEELSLAITLLTCRFCVGEGTTAHCCPNPVNGGTKLLSHVFSVRLCPNCTGTGIAPGITLRKDHTA